MAEEGEDFSFTLEKPVEEGETYEVDIIGEGKEGDGVAKIDNFVVFVDGANEGDHVEIEITEVRGRSAVGKVVE